MNETIEKYKHVTLDQIRFHYKIKIQEVMELDALGENAGIVGTWIEQGYKEDVLNLERAEKFDPSKYGFTISDDSTSRITKDESGFKNTTSLSHTVYFAHLQRNVGHQCGFTQYARCQQITLTAHCDND